MSQDIVTMLVFHAKLKLGARKTNARMLKTTITEILDNIQRDIDVVVLPPYPFTGPVIGYYPDSRVKSIISGSAEILSQKNTIRGHGAAEFLRRLAIDLGVDIISGPMIERAGPRLYITVTLVDRMGNIVSKYRKIGVTRAEASNGIHPGKEVTVFRLQRGGASIGVFVDEDLVYPEVFRAIQASGANIIVGFMLPYLSDHLKLIADDSNMLTMDLDTVESFLSVRSRETGLPMILVGGMVESNNKPHIVHMPTIPVEPDVGVVKNKIRGSEALWSYLTIEVDVGNSRPAPLNRTALGLCKKIYSLYR